ncbi:MAG: 2-amino-4-hydroxy-6-hydroxymethyldihydropteridine diphosphokinase [Succinivibrio sp.]|nr:2-amino-4-hydroxy-6-hydroxymethyldihydropteridine diphosphokinase [Succinivibrio sp.]
MSNKVYLGVGSNLNREQALLFARAKVAQLFTQFKCSSVWRSHAVRAAEPDYYNAVMGGETELTLEQMYEQISRIEASAGKELMFNNGTNFGIKRRLDIDILVYNDLVCNEPCKLPRHDIQDYPFVLCPLCEIDRELEHPLLKIKVGDLWTEMEPRLPDNMMVTKVDFDWQAQAPEWNA